MNKINLFESVPVGDEVAAIKEVLMSKWWGYGREG